LTHRGKISFFLLPLIFVLNVQAGAQEFTFRFPNYDFINYEESILHFEGESQKYFELFYRKLNKLITKGDGQIQILHIGDSHIQADFFPGEMRQRVQSFEKGIQGARGFIFPYSVAKTNNPPDYKVSASGNWERCRNITRQTSCDLGIAGINIMTTDSVSSMTFQFNNKAAGVQIFNQIRIYHNIRQTGYDFILKNYEGPLKKVVNLAEGYTEFWVKEYLTSLELVIYRCDSNRNPFVLHGIYFGNDFPGIVYSSLGVNGAETYSFLRCNLFEEQLKSLHPDLVIISLGTNDAYPKGFNSDIFYTNYDSLLKKVRNALPDAALILTTPGDSYRNKNHSNVNNAKAGEVIYMMALQHDAAVWDLYEVMGGLNSILKWQRKGLTNADRLHLSKEGYILQGELLFSAFFDSYDTYLNKYIGEDGLD